MPNPALRQSAPRGAAGDLADVRAAELLILRIGRDRTYRDEHEARAMLARVWWRVMERRQELERGA